MRKLKLGKNADTEKAAAVNEAFKVFRKEAVRHKGMVKRAEMPMTEFSAWLIEQQDEIDRLMES